MTFKNGHDDDTNNVTSIADARKRAAEKLKAEKRAAAAGVRGPRTWRDIIIGSMIILLALGYLVQLFVGLDTTPATGGGTQ